MTQAYACFGLNNYEYELSEYLFMQILFHIRYILRNVSCFMVN
jgi:hypothetical protein